MGIPIRGEKVDMPGGIPVYGEDLSWIPTAEIDWRRTTLCTLWGSELFQAQSYAVLPHAVNYQACGAAIAVAEVFAIEEDEYGIWFTHRKHPQIKLFKADSILEDAPIIVQGTNKPLRKFMTVFMDDNNRRYNEMEWKFLIGPDAVKNAKADPKGFNSYNWSSEISETNLEDPFELAIKDQIRKGFHIPYITSKNDKGPTPNFLSFVDGQILNGYRRFLKALHNPRMFE